MDIYTKLTSRYLFPLHERLKGHDTASILAELENSQWLAPDLIAERQGRALRQLLDHAIRTVPYFRQRLDARITRPDRSLEDLLHELPVTDKPTIRAHFADWRAEGADGLTELRTSGSSGSPCAFCSDVIASVSISRQSGVRPAGGQWTSAAASSCCGVPRSRPAHRT